MRLQLYCVLYAILLLSPAIAAQSDQSNYEKGDSIKFQLNIIEEMETSDIIGQLENDDSAEASLKLAIIFYIEKVDVTRAETLFGQALIESESQEFTDLCTGIIVKVKELNIQTSKRKTAVANVISAPTGKKLREEVEKWSNQDKTEHIKRMESMSPEAAIKL